MSKAVPNMFELTGDVGFQSGNSYNQLVGKKTTPQIPIPEINPYLGKSVEARLADQFIAEMNKQKDPSVTKAIENAKIRDSRNQAYGNFGQFGDSISNVSDKLMTAGAAFGNAGMFKAGMLGGFLGNGISKLSSLKSTKGLSGDDLLKTRQGNIQAGLGAAGDIADGVDKVFFGDQEAKQSSLTQGLDMGYDTAANAVSMIPGWGTVVGGAMKLGGLATDALRKAGFGTDQITTADKIFDSKFMKLLPSGIINSIGAKRTNKFSVDRDTMEEIGGDYGGTSKWLQSTADLAGKKFGTFSSKARRRANRQIDLAREKQGIMTDIANEARDQRDMVNGTQQLNWLNYTQKLNGGIGDYKLSAKNGAKLRRIKKFKAVKVEKPVEPWEPTITEFKDGGNLDTWTPKYYQEGGRLSYEEWIKDLNPDFINENYDLKSAYEHFDSSTMDRWKNAVNSKIHDEKNPLSIDYKDPKTGEYINHLQSVVPLENGDYMFLKLGNVNTNKEVLPEIEYYNSGGGDLLNTHDLVFEGDRYYYRKKKEFLKDGGQIEPLSTQENVIPDGALHKNKHHMENDDNITKKGIPVIDNEGQQQAEIELNEIIFSLEVTKKLEELYRQFRDNETSQKEKDDLAIEAGKLLVYEILHHTKDNTGLLKEITKE